MHEAAAQIPKAKPASTSHAGAADNSVSPAGQIETQAADSVAVKPLKPFSGNNLKLAEYSNNTWQGVAAAGVTVDDLENPNLWTVCARDFHVFDTIKIVAHDASWWAELLVYDQDPMYASVKLLRSTSLPPRASAGEKRCPPGYEILPAETGTAGFIILRTEGNVVMTDSGTPFATRELALRYLLDHAVFRSNEVRYT